VIAVSDTHELQAQRLVPIIAEGLRSFSMKDQPVIVTVLPPEAGPFMLVPLGRMSPKASYRRAFFLVPTRFANVTWTSLVYESTRDTGSVVGAQTSDD
jgi:hypothetical protein